MKVYLDVCCLCRPFDDQTNGRIRREATAIHEIIRRCVIHEFSLVSSEAVTEEISRIPDIAKRLRVERIVSGSEEFVKVDEGIISRMDTLVADGCDTMDSLHIACAERAGATLLTTDDGLITFFKSHQNIQVIVKNPVPWLQERIQ